MTWKVYAFQALLWLCPVLLSAATLALETPFAHARRVEQPRILESIKKSCTCACARLCVGACVNLVFGLLLELFHILAQQKEQPGATPGQGS